jgi:hypothetical protein
MDDDALLPQIVDAVQKTQQAFQNLLSNPRVAHGTDSQDIQGIGVAMQALGTIVEILEGIESSGVQLELVHKILSNPTALSVSGYNISIAETLISDMRNLEQRMIDMNRRVAPDGMINSPPGEAMRIRTMVEKYHSIISQIPSGQTMCVAMVSIEISILIF